MLTKHELVGLGISSHLIMNDLEAVAKTIGYSVDEWEGDCHGISALFLKYELVPGRVARGHWLGPVSVKSTFAKNVHLGFCQHSWIAVGDLDEHIIDPTRWAFQKEEPFIYIGTDDEGWYDEGGNQVRMTSLIENGCPQFNDSGKVFLLPTNESLMGFPMAIKDLSVNGKLSAEQLLWLANYDPTLFGDARALYTWIKGIGLKAFVPLDNWKMVFASDWG